MNPETEMHIFGGSRNLKDRLLQKERQQKEHNIIRKIVVPEVRNEKNETNDEKLKMSTPVYRKERDK